MEKKLSNSMKLVREQDLNMWSEKVTKRQNDRKKELKNPIKSRIKVQ